MNETNDALLKAAVKFADILRFLRKMVFLVKDQACLSAGFWPVKLVLTDRFA